MIPRLHNLKQAAALGAILLVLSAQVHHAGVLCYWGACGYASLAGVQAIGSGACGGSDACGDACCDGTRGSATNCHTSNCDDQSTSPVEAPAPCPEGSWCRPTLPPLDQPKLFEASIELNVHEALAIDAPVSPQGTDRLVATIRRAYAAEHDETSSVDGCADLCRLLI